MTKNDDENLLGTSTPEHVDVQMQQKKHSIIDKTEGLSNRDLLETYMNAPEDKLLPWEDVRLPSDGIYYGWIDGTVKVRPMGTAAEKVLTNQRLAQDGQNIDYLFRECVMLQNGMDPADLLIGDRAFLLYYIRGLTHGNIYEFMFTCPNESCGKSTTYNYDLNALAETIKWANHSLGAEPFKIDLPYASQILSHNVSVEIRFLRAVDTNNMIAMRKARKNMFSQGLVRNRTQNKAQGNFSRTQDAEDMITDNLARMIVSVLGETDEYTIKRFVEKMHASDTATIREWLRENTPGIDNTVIITCPSCNNDFTVELPMTEGFFRPAKSGTIRKPT
jgi:hypothetical protein